MNAEAFLATAENSWVLVCFCLFLALPFLFAACYRWLYRQDQGHFFFPRDAVFESRLQRQRDRLEDDIKHLDKVIDVVGALIEHLIRNPEQCRDSFPNIALPDGRSCRFEPHEDVNPSQTDVIVRTLLTVLDATGGELVRTWLDRDGFGLPRDPTSLRRGLETYIAEWRHVRSQKEQELQRAERG